MAPIPRVRVAETGWHSPLPGLLARLALCAVGTAVALYLLEPLLYAALYDEPFRSSEAAPKSWPSQASGVPSPSLSGW